MYENKVKNIFLYFYIYIFIYFYGGVGDWTLGYHSKKFRHFPNIS